MKIIIVDDDEMVYESLQLLFSREKDIKVIGTANDGAQAIAACEASQPDAVLMDIQMPGMDGIQATRELKRRWPQIRVMMLTTFEDERNIRLALLAGAEGYLLKSAPVQDMAQQLRALDSGSSVLHANVLRQLTQPEKKGLDVLTTRETDILQLVAQGCSNKEISSQLFISEGTVRNTISIILDKLEVRDRTQLALYYWRRV
ncbi:response regulator transcription factor [Gracilibacillus alcaliphilus]|uniref:response regulator transcription factor n=1 Tax=Gracilibacillus alcaliphilus TaxID=1401441 RepID=UPI001959CECD|nr:response regulator transcription factor [Gracilibacillus alcaliphilus]MBM7675749.1 DNA-binding NarL/FixJ family response regulator [Gracilibacillus alcaliphilus]